MSDRSPCFPQAATSKGSERPSRVPVPLAAFRAPPHPPLHSPFLVLLSEASGLLALSRSPHSGDRSAHVLIRLLQTVPP